MSLLNARNESVRQPQPNLHIAKAYLAGTDSGVSTAMQRLELSFLAALPANQRSLIPDGQPVVLEIVVTEAKDGEKRAQEMQE